MRFSTRFLVGCAFAILGYANLNALNLKVCQVDPQKQNATVYLRWEGDDYTNGDITYTVKRANNGSWETVAQGLKRLEYFDLSVKPGEKYQYQIESSAGNTVTSQELSIPNRNHAHPVYSLNVEYEISLDELLKDGWKTQGFHAPTFSQNPGEVCNDISWRTKKPVSDDYDKTFLPKSTEVENSYNDEQLQTLTKDDFYLDGNRYLWIEDGTRSSGEEYKCEIPNFRVNGDQVLEATHIAKTTESAERYPWAGVGYSWRSVMDGASSYNKQEKCWYINVREDGKYGVLCVWGPDQFGRRPYQNHPFYLDWKKFREDYDGTYDDATFGTTYPFDDKSASDDEVYSIAFSEHGRSYIRRTNNDNYTKLSIYFAAHTNHVMGRRHDWKPNRENGNSRYLKAHSASGHALPGSRADLLNVKGNIGAANVTDSNDPTQKQTYGWICQVPNYNNLNDQLIFRFDRVNSDRDTDAANRIRVKGWKELYKAIDSQEGYKGTQNYIIPMSGNGCDDAFAQLSNSTRTPSEKYPHLLYLHKDLVNGTKATTTGADGDATLYTTDRNINDNTDGIQRIDLGLQYNHIVGGCTFDFKGEKYIVLAATRQGDYNMGDFTIFRIDGRTTGNDAITLTPVVNYTSPAIENKQWSSTAGIGANPNRTYIRTYLKKENRAGFDNDDQYVEIYVYLPGRTINMYTFYGTYVPDGKPVVEMLPNIVTNEEYLSTNNHQYMVNYDVVTGEAKERHTDNATAPHLKEFYTHIDWNNYRSDMWEAPADRDTKVLLNELQSTNYLQDKDGNKQSATPYASRKETGIANYWALSQHIGGAYGSSIETRPQYKRKIGNAEQTLYGNVSESSSSYYYAPQPVKNLTVKSYYGNQDQNGNRFYRVDINFDAPEAVWGYNVNSDGRANAGSAQIPVTRYEISRDGRNGLTALASKPVAYVMTGSSSYPCWEDGQLYDPKSIYAVQAKDQSVVTPGSSKCVVIPGNYNFANRNNAMYALMTNRQDDGKGACVLTIISKDPEILNDTYRVRTVYGTDNWNGDTAEYGTYGVSKYADATARPVDSGFTGIEDIVGDADTDAAAEYYTLQGFRLAGAPTAPGVYLKRTSAGTAKVQIR